ncbi:4-(cytidine 5'-diphospho)-2-C-methyl-D-erythritol kinase [Nocardioides sp. GY 10113]|uniref:4-(cytidine 5'-diphospho)-2-C-methyl-D-erythritol kinase n=1 Tax=Nocardioides sp. GY 10113 TaxID=2569761 RepID=UPI0010A931B3|nr:4-(cytidine 5'-diphospho)-2-C-methyl-D-erythritol kinase [Nocardioides sp. GY 10113]TIC85956.1 4-(cytidine 5'-diphospho)-2-C-methyl-D-erythritol kinase [Nocardioides sp. GY 10113]
MTAAALPPSPGVTVRAPAKVNLHLGVGAPRPDGLHPLATVYQAVGLYDDVTVCDAPEWRVELVEPDPSVPLDDGNIALRAGRALVEHHGLDLAAEIRIDKGIPVAGGMAGGSADAAATLVALDRLWGLDTSDTDLLRIAAELGSDVPFALIGGTAMGTGRGELVEPLADATDLWWVVVLSDDGLSTPAAYRHFDELHPDAPSEPPHPDALVAALAAGDVAAVADRLENDLWAAARDLRPDLVEVEADLRSMDPLAVLLSGSGPTLLMLFGDVDAARAALADVTALGHRASIAPGPVAGAHVVHYG